MHVDNGEHESMQHPSKLLIRYIDIVYPILAIHVFLNRKSFSNILQKFSLGCQSNKRPGTIPSCLFLIYLYLRAGENFPHRPKPDLHKRKTFPFEVEKYIFAIRVERPWLRLNFSELGLRSPLDVPDVHSINYSIFLWKTSICLRWRADVQNQDVEWNLGRAEKLYSHHSLSQLIISFNW